VQTGLVHMKQTADAGDDEHRGPEEDPYRAARPPARDDDREDRNDDQRDPCRQRRRLRFEGKVYGRHEDLPRRRVKHFTEELGTLDGDEHGGRDPASAQRHADNNHAAGHYHAARGELDMCPARSTTR